MGFVQTIRPEAAAGNRKIKGVNSYLNTLSKQNLVNAAYATVIDNVLVQKWGLLAISGNRYSVQVPTDRKVKTAWDSISALCDLQGQKEKIISFFQIWRKLTAPPYGYNELAYVALLGAWLVRHRQEVKIGLRVKNNDGTIGMSEVSLTRFIAPDSKLDQLFGKKKEFLHFFTLNDCSFLIHREPITDVVVPDKIMFDGAAPLLAKIDEYLALDGHTQLKADGLLKKRRSIEEGVEQIKSWLTPILEVLAGALPLSIADVIHIYAAIAQEPDDSSDSILVTPTQAQLDKQLTAMEKCKRAIEAKVSTALSNVVDSSSGSELNSLLNQVERDSEACREVPTLFVAFEARFEAIRLAAQRRSEELGNQEKLREAIERVERLSAGLNANSSEQSLKSASDELRRTVEVASGLISTSAYKSAAAKISLFQSALAGGLTDWRKHAEAPQSSRVAERLREEILARKERYDSESSIPVVAGLINDLAIKSEELRHSEGSELAARQQVDAAIALEKQIRSLPDIVSCIRLYDEFPLMIENVPRGLRSRVLTELETTAQTARTGIADKVGAICDERVSSLNDFDYRTVRLTQIKAELLTRGGFIEVTDKIDLALKSLSDGRKILIERESDAKLIDRIRQIKPDSLSSVTGCRQEIADVAKLKGQLHNPSTFASEVDQLVAKLHAKARGFMERLDNIRNNLTTVAKLEELTLLQRSYHQLDPVFHGSDLEADYLAVEARFSDLKGDLELLADLRFRAKAANSVLTCRATLDLVSSKTPELRDPARFGAEIGSINTQIAARLESYTKTLAEHRDGVATALTRNDAEKLLDRVIALTDLFVGSELQGQYVDLRSEVGSLVSLMRDRKPRQDLRTRQECEVAIEKIERFRADTIVGASPILQERVNDYEREVRAVLLAIDSALRRAAAEWLRRIADVAERVRLEPADPESPALVADVLNRIAVDSSSHKLYLGSIGLKELDQIQIYCREVVDSNLEAQILALLGQLPFEKQAAICQRLTAALQLQVVVPSISETPGLD